MHRCLLAIGVVVGTLPLCSGCGSSKKPDVSLTRVSVTTSSEAKQRLARGKLTTPAATAEIPFTVELPGGWSWQDGRAEKFVTSSVSIYVSFTATDVPPDERAQSPHDAVMEQVAKLADERTLNDSVTGGRLAVRDRRIIKVDEKDAVWDVVAFQPAEDDLPTRLEARCYIRLGDKAFTIECARIDVRSTRTAVAFDESQAEFLKISQSFRVDQSAH
jgi:hypothetical protein